MVKRFNLEVPEWGVGDLPWMVERDTGEYCLFADHEAAIAKAVAAEHEKCARVADNAGYSGPWIGKLIRESKQ